MQLTRENATFFQNGFNFYIGDINIDDTVLFKEDFIVMGNIKTAKNIFSMGGLILVGDAEAKSIYVCRDLLCIGNIKADSIEVDGTSKIMDKEVLASIWNVNIFNNIELLNSKEDKHENSNKKGNVIEVEEDHIKAFESEEKNVVDNIDYYKAYERYISKKGDLIEGKIIDIKTDKIIVELEGNIYGYLTKNSLDNLYFNIGTTINAYIKSVYYNGECIEIILNNSDNSFIRKVINKELLEKNYDTSNIFIKKIARNSEDEYSVIIQSTQHTQEILKDIEGKVKSYLNGRQMKLQLYKNMNLNIENNNKEISVTKLEKGQKNNELDKPNNKSSSIDTFSIGDHIDHRKIGKGIIIGIENEDILVIRFDSGVKRVSLDFVLKNELIYKLEDNIQEVSNSIDKIKSINNCGQKLLDIYEKKKWTLIEGTVKEIYKDQINVNINDEIIGILKRSNDSIENKNYNLEDKVIFCISSLYLRGGYVEAQIYRNSSNYFKLLFEKFKEYIGLKNYNIKICKYSKKSGVTIVVEKKYGPWETETLKYIEQLMNKEIGKNITHIVEFKYDPYLFLSDLFKVDSKNISFASGFYNIHNISKERKDELEEIIEEIRKKIKYKIKINTN